MDVNPYEGQILLVDKPLTWTSFDVVKKLKYALKVKKIGHAGTLDPLATGLLLIGTGKCTKKLNELQGLDKVYTGIIGIGKTTPSYDLETPFENEVSVDHVTDEMIQDATSKLTGAILQVPPAHSAVKVNGERAYKKARKNLEVRLGPRALDIYSFHTERLEADRIRFEIHCSKGTYIRSIARDIGELLGVGGHLKSLRREKIGTYDVADAEKLDEFVERVRNATD